MGLKFGIEIDSNIDRNLCENYINHVLDIRKAEGVMMRY